MMRYDAPVGRCETKCRSGSKLVQKDGEHDEDPLTGVPDHHHAAVVQQLSGGVVADGLHALPRTRGQHHGPTLRLTPLLRVVLTEH